jgi:hypothetical protein
LINSDVLPRLSKSALLDLVKWVVKRREREEQIENNGMESDSQGSPFSADQPIRSNGCKKIKNEFNRGGNG